MALYHQFRTAKTLMDLFPFMKTHVYTFGTIHKALVKIDLMMAIF